MGTIRKRSADPEENTLSSLVEIEVDESEPRHFSGPVKTPQHMLAADGAEQYGNMT